MLFISSLYLLLTLVLDTSRVRTFVVVGSQSTSEFFYASFLAQYACRFLSLAALSFSSTFAPSKEETLEGSGFLSHVFVTWALPLMWKGRHGNLELEQLPNLDPDMDTALLYSRFEVHWRSERYVNHLINPYYFRRLFLPRPPEQIVGTTHPSRALSL